MLSQVDYINKCKLIGVKGNWDTYTKCYNEYKNYFDLVLDKIAHKKKIIVVFMESGPKEINNYIFSETSKTITLHEKRVKGEPDPDQYLIRIYKGFIENDVLSEKTKNDALEDLLNREVPVVLMDLFPFHGIKLVSDNREKICDNLNLMLDDAKEYLSKIEDYDKYIIFGVPYTIWHLTGGQGPGSLYADKFLPLCIFKNSKVVINMGGQSLSSKFIKKWVKSEKLG